ncbi:MAG: phosphoenolpyruvate hydrolase family protein [Thermodesulfobacteriota bacterium]|nr:phosphoenolpyruvate hydrolase family protein [Thermodesulfobacteriota bacterium]
MVKRFTRQEIVGRFKTEIEKGQAIFDAFAGTGISAKFAEAGGADMITTHILARFRMAGLSSMAGYLSIADANAVTLELGKRDIIPVIKSTPVMAGLLGADPTRNMDYFLDEIIAAGFSGILNCPTLALIDGNFRKTLEETGVTYDKDVEMIAIAHRKGLYTKAFCTSPEEAKKMMEAGCDNIIAHGGNTSGGSIGSKTVTPVEAMIGLIQNIIDTVKRKKPDVMVTCHGGATETPQDVTYLLEKVKGLDGYVGGSTAERIPVEKSITEAVRGFKNIQLPAKTRWS